jgi:hypothetical protein
MTWTTIEDRRFNRVVLEESKALGNYATRDIVKVTTDTATGDYLLGTILVRAINVDSSLAWRVLDAAADIAITNEYAILIGDDFEANTSKVNLVNGTAKNVVAITNNTRIREAGLKDIPFLAALSVANFSNLKQQLKKHNLFVEATTAQ